MSVATSKQRVPAWPFFLLGFLLPIDTIAGVSAVTLDVARYGVAAALIVWMLATRRAPRMNRALAWGGSLLMLTGTLGFVKAGFSQDATAIVTSMVGLGSVAVAFMVARNQVHFAAILRGFVAASVWSALDILMQWAGLPFLGTLTADAYRYSGFTFSSTHVAPLLAVALCVTLTHWAWRRRSLVVRMLATAILAAGLLVSQGRVGVAALGVALLVWLLARFAKRPARTLIAALIVGTPVFIFTGLDELLSQYLIRADRPGGITSGRTELNAQAWGAFTDAGFFGIDQSERGLYIPHLAPLTAGLDVGWLGLVSTTVLCLMLAWFAAFAPPRVPVVFRMIAAIALVAAMIEPTGFFVGFSRAMLLMLCLASLWNPPTKRVPQDAERIFLHGQNNVPDRLRHRSPSQH